MDILLIVFFTGLFVWYASKQPAPNRYFILLAGGAVLMVCFFLPEFANQSIYNG